MCVLVLFSSFLAIYYSIVHISMSMQSWNVLECVIGVIKIAGFKIQCPAKHTRDRFSMNNLGVHLKSFNSMVGSGG